MLDYVVTRYICYASQANPGQLRDARSALGNNNYFSAMPSKFCNITDAFLRKRKDRSYVKCLQGLAFCSCEFGDMFAPGEPISRSKVSQHVQGMDSSVLKVQHLLTVKVKIGQQQQLTE